MYVILVNEDNTLCTTKRERIMQRSKLVNELWFLVNPDYNGVDMSACTVHMEYKLPVSKKYCDEILVLSEDRYKDHLKYVLPFDTKLTAEAGDIEIQLTFLYVDLENGKPVQRARKISSTTITIHPIAAWSDLIPDDVLTPLDQRIIQIDAQLKALSDTAEAIHNEKADDIEYNPNTKEMQLKSGDKLIGKKVVLDNCECDEEGVPAVDITTAIGDDFEEDESQLTDVVMF